MQSCLDALQLQVDAALGFLLDSCSPDGEFRPSLLDDHQLAAYELAFCAAELQAAAALANHAATAEDELLQALAPGYGADTLQSVWGRLLANASAMGLSRSELLQLMQEPPLAPFLDRHQGESTLAAIGEALLDRGHACLPDGLDSEKAMVRDSFARFTDQVVEPLAEDVHRQDLDIPDSLIEAAAELGCFGACIPQRFGGLLPDDGGDTVGMIVVTEELSRGSLGAAGSLVTRPEIAARALLSGGTARQQQRWLPRLAAAQVLSAIAVTEPDYGSDVASVALRATRVPGGWQLSGSKTWCTFAGKAELLVTLARSAPDPALGHRGLSLFLVEKPAFAGHAFEHVQQSGGKLTGRAIATIGYRGMHSFDLAFDEYFVPEANLVGEDGGEGRGFYHAMAGFAGGRIQTAARATGVMQAALDRALAYAAQRKVFGATIGDYQLTRVKLGRMLGALTASRQFSYAVARMMDEGNGQMEASLVKLFACRAAEWVTREAMQIHGGMGYAEESPVSRYYVDARVLSIFEGAEETLALKVIARDLVANAKRST
jgi:(2S)-methylsuccinyl-CoA dehydrogenase